MTPSGMSHSSYQCHTLHATITLSLLCSCLAFLPPSVDKCQGFSAKRFIPSWKNFGLPLSRKSFLPQMKPHPIPFLEKDFLPSFVSHLLILLYLPFNGVLDLSMQVLDHISFCLPILACPCLMSGKGKKI